MSPLTPAVSPPDCMSLLVQLRLTCLTEPGIILFTIHTYHEDMILWRQHTCVSPGWGYNNSPPLPSPAFLLLGSPPHRDYHSDHHKAHFQGSPQYWPKTTHRPSHIYNKKEARTYSGKVCLMQMKRKLIHSIRYIFSTQQSTGCKPRPPGRLPVYTCLHSDCAAWSPWVPCADVISS